MGLCYDLLLLNLFMLTWNCLTLVVVDGPNALITYSYFGGTLIYPYSPYLLYFNWQNNLWDQIIGWGSVLTTLYYEPFTMLLYSYNLYTFRPIHVSPGWTTEKLNPLGGTNYRPGIGIWWHETTLPLVLLYNLYTFRPRRHVSPRTLLEWMHLMSWDCYVS